MNNQYADRHPYWAAALLSLTTLVVFFISGMVVTLRELPATTVLLIALPLMGLVGVFLLTRNRWWRDAGFRGPYERRLLWLFWLPLVPVVANLAFGGAAVPEPVDIALYFLLALLAGFVEETLFRGLILRALIPTGVWRAALISAVLFGGLHALTGLSGSNLADILRLVGYATAVGFGYAALAIRTGTIWPLILAHFLNNLSSYLTAGGPVTTGEMVYEAVSIVLFGAYGAYLLWSRRMQDPDPGVVVYRPEKSRSAA